MAADRALVAELRRFRLGLVAVMALPWAAGLLLVPFVGWHRSFWSTTGLALVLLVDALLALFAWRRPIGIATALIVLRLVAGAALTVAFGRGVGALLIAFAEAAFATLLIWLALPLLRRARAGTLAPGLRASERGRIDDRYASADRRASARRYARLERRGVVERDSPTS